MLFFGKVRIDVEKLAELGQKLQSGELDRSFIQSTFSLKDDPTVGLNIWEDEDREELDKKLTPHKIYYAEVSEIAPVITPQEAQQLLVQRLV